MQRPSLFPPRSTLSHHTVRKLDPSQNIPHRCPGRNRLTLFRGRETRVASPDQARASVDVLPAAGDGSAGTGTGSRPGTGELGGLVNCMLTL